MGKIKKFKKDYIFWFKRYSLTQIGSYSVSFLSYILYLVPILNNDPLIYSYLISTISLLRLKIYLMDVLAFFPHKENFKYINDIKLRELMIYVIIGLTNITIYSLLAKVNFLISISLTFFMLIGVHITYLNNYDLHSQIRENTISKRSLFMFGFIPRLTSTLLLFIYILVVRQNINNIEINIQKYIAILGMYLFPPLIYRIYFLDKISILNLVRKFKSTFYKKYLNIRFQNIGNHFDITYLNLTSLTILNIAFFIIMIRLYPMTTGNIFKLPISITLFFNTLMLISRVKNAYNYSINKFLNISLKQNLSILIFPLTIFSFIVIFYTKNFISLYMIAIVTYSLSMLIVHLDKSIIFNRINTKNTVN